MQLFGCGAACFFVGGAGLKIALKMVTVSALKMVTLSALKLATVSGLRLAAVSLLRLQPLLLLPPLLMAQSSLLLQTLPPQNATLRLPSLDCKH